MSKLYRLRKSTLHVYYLCCCLFSLLACQTLCLAYEQIEATDVRYIQLETGPAAKYDAGIDTAWYIGCVIYEFDYLDITVGWLQPLNYDNGGATCFSAITKLQHWTDKEVWLFNPGIGLHVRMSHDYGWGLNLNLLSWRF